MQCPVCLAVLPDEARFCLQCGTAAPRASNEPVDPLRDTLKIALGRQYEVLQLLGRGGMGAVYLARETALEREVAIKVLPHDRGTTMESRDRFRREARTAARLFHPNIVPLYTFGDVEGTLYFVMGFINGESLAAKLRREGAMPADEAQRILVEIADALDYAHQLGIVHRDIKPDNVLIEEVTGRAMLTDFGVAKALGVGQTMTLEGSLLGTPHYMSPEQAQGKSDIDHRSDLYSLGVTGYMMLAGRLPFEGNSTGEILMQHITKEPPPLKTLAPEVPQEIASALTRCLAKDPSERWSDARSLRSALSPADDELPPALEGVSNIGVIALVPLFMLLYFGVWSAGGGDITTPMSVVSMFAASFFILILVLVVAEKWFSAKKSGVDPARVRFEILRQPRWWTGPYPRRYRAKSDVWDRLPIELRQARSGMALWISVSTVLCLPGFLLMEAFDAYVERMKQPPYSAFLNHVIVISLLGVCVVLFIVGLITVSTWERHARALGINDPHLRAYLMSVPTGKRSFWAKPEIAALLSPAGDKSDRLSEIPNSPRALAEAISRAVTPIRAVSHELASRITTVARRAGASLVALDKEIGALSGAFDSAEAQRLQAKLAALPEGDEYREAREMMRRQLDLVRGMETRLDEVKARRAQRLEMLRTLWQTVRGSASSGSTERITALCDEIDGGLALGSSVGSVAGTDALADMPTLKA
jgi:predicted Ser/Thr protein kinase